MENWQLTLIVLSAVLVGALIPLLMMMTLAFYRIGREVDRIGARLNKSLETADIVIQRTEVLSRGFKEHEQTIPNLLASVDQITRGLNHNLRIIHTVSTAVEAIVAAIRTYLATRAAPVPASPKAEMPQP